MNYYTFSRARIYESHLIGLFYAWKHILCIETQVKSSLSNALPAKVTCYGVAEFEYALPHLN